VLLSWAAAAAARHCTKCSFVESELTFFDRILKVVSGTGCSWSPQCMLSKGKFNAVCMVSLCSIGVCVIGCVCVAGVMVGVDG